MVLSPWAVLAFPAALLVGFAFGAAGMAATSFMRTWQDFDLVQLVILPLFLFSATFYPITTYPEPIRTLVQLTPLYHGVDLIRGLTTGDVGPGLPGPRRLPRRDGPARPGGHVAAPRQAAAEVGPGRAILPPMSEPDATLGARARRSRPPRTTARSASTSAGPASRPPSWTWPPASWSRRGSARGPPSRRPRRRSSRRSGVIVDRLAEGGHLDPTMPAGAGLPGVVKRGRLADRGQHRPGLGRTSRPRKRSRSASAARFA